MSKSLGSDKERVIKFFVPVHWVEGFYDGDMKVYRVCIPVGKLEEVAEPLLSRQKRKMLSEIKSAVKKMGTPETVIAIQYSSWLGGYETFRKIVIQLLEDFGK